MLLIYSLVVFNYSILRGAKDALLITAPGSGANAIPYIKLWGILPIAFLTTLIFTRLSNKYSRDRVFYIMMSGFLGFFFLFTFFLYPLRDYLHPHALADHLETLTPQGLHGLIAIFRNWTFSLFYIMGELWGTIIMSVLFWGFANEVTSVREAKRFYAILGVGANLGTILAAQLGIFLSSEYLYQLLPFNGDRWGQSLTLTTLIILSVGIAVLLIYRKLTQGVLYKEIVESEPLGKSSNGDKIKMGIRKNFAYLAKSKYLICIAIIVLTYNIALNLIEVVWKDQVHQLYPYGADNSVYMYKVLSYVGILSTFFGIFLCGQTIRRFGWTKSAAFTPIVMLITAILFFTFYIFRDVGAIGTISALLGTTPLILSTFFGALQNCLARSSKFTFFDATKEMAFIPLSKECKLKGKAAIDGVGSRIGKSGGALIHQVLLLCFGTLTLSTPFVAVIVLLVIGAWLSAVRSLGKQFSEISQNEDATELPKEELSEEPLQAPSAMQPEKSPI